MAALTCDICGGNLTMNESGEFAICESCGMKHTKERVKVKVQEVKGTVTIEGVVETRVSDFTIRGGLLERYNGESLTVTIPNNVKIIGYQAFRGCGAIQEIILPNSVIKIESQAFSYCKELRKISIPDSVTVIEGFAFEFCENLETIELPNSIIDLGKDHNTWHEGGTFYRCSNLKTIKLPKSISVIRKDTFKECSKLEYIEIPDGCVHIEAGAFENCENLKSVKIPHNIEKISGSWSYGSNTGAFAKCINLEHIEIHNGSIEDYAFYGCSRLKNIYIGCDVKSISPTAFLGCENIECVTNLSPTVNKKAFKNTLWFKNNEQNEKVLKDREQISNNSCRFCGGEFKGVFKKVCSKCGKPKDY